MKEKKKVFPAKVIKINDFKIICSILLFMLCSVLFLVFWDFKVKSKFKNWGFKASIFCSILSYNSG